MRNSYLASILLLLFVYTTHSHANDSVIEIGAGGLVFKEEKNISLLKETLDISRDRILVEYEFKNTSLKDIEVNVGFPIPSFGIESPASTQKYPPNFQDFKVIVNGSAVPYKTDISAITKDGINISNILSEKQIDITSFGEFDIFSLADGLVSSAKDLEKYQINKLSNAEVEYLISQKALDKERIPIWDNKITYYWHQKFPAQQITKINHSYTPYLGGAYAYQYSHDSFFRAGDSCIDNGLQKKLSEHLTSSQLSIDGDRHRIDYQWASYILVTANSWKMPIQQFELIIRKNNKNHSKSEKPASYISLCWDGKFSKIDSNTFKSSIKNYTPDKDLLIYWFTLN